MKKSTQSLLGFLAFSFLGFSLQTNAQSLQKGDTVSIEPFTVSVTRNNLSKDKLPQQVQVIEREAIQSSGSKDIADVIKKTAGIDIVQYPGMTSGVGMRGFRPQVGNINPRTLILINGRPSATTNLAMIAIDQVERLEILKGAASALYGSSAMGGVINIITANSTGDIQSMASVSIGSFNTTELGLTTGGALNSKFDFDFNMKHFQQNGNFRLGDDNLLRNHFEWNEVKRNYYPDDRDTPDSTIASSDVRGDGQEREFTQYQYQSSDIRFGYTINSNWKVNVSGSFFSGNNVQSPGDLASGNASQGLKNPYRYTGDIRVQGRIGDNHNIQITTYRGNDFSDYRTASAGVVSPNMSSETMNSFKGLQVQDNYKWKNHTLTFGIDRMNSRTTSKAFSWSDGSEIAPWSPNYNIQTNAFFAQGHFNLLEDKLQASVGARFDAIQSEVENTPLLETQTSDITSNSVVNPNLGLKYNLNKNLNVHTSFGTAFVTPEAFKLAGESYSGPGASQAVVSTVSVTRGNPDLLPETSTTFDIGIGYSMPENGLEADLTFFTTNVKDRVYLEAQETPTETQTTADGDTIVGIRSFANANRSLMSGIEYRISWDVLANLGTANFLKLHVQGNHFLEYNEDLYEPASGLVNTINRRIQNVAKNTLIYGLSFGNETFSSSLNGRFVGTRTDTDWNDWMNTPEIEYAPFMVLDWNVQFNLNAKTQLGLQLNNLTDENYYEKYGFNMPGRNIHVRVAYRF